MNTRLVLLIVSLPPNPSSLRVRGWRRDEARGIDLAIRGHLAAHADDQQVLTHCLTLFEGLYAAVPGKD
jgi:hypothetical protein